MRKDILIDGKYGSIYKLEFSLSIDEVNEEKLKYYRQDKKKFEVYSNHPLVWKKALQRVIIIDTGDIDTRQISTKTYITKDQLELINKSVNDYLEQIDTITIKEYQKELDNQLPF